MKNFAFDSNEINKSRPSKEVSKQKLAKYKLKSELGLFELFDESTLISEIDIRKAGFENFAEYEELRTKVANMIDNNVVIPEELATKLMMVKQIIK